MATLHETLLTYPAVADLEEFLPTVLLHRGADGEQTYTGELRPLLELCVADLYAQIGALADFSDNKLTVTYPRKWFAQRAIQLYRQHGETDTANALALASGGVPKGKAGASW